jgi:hypothetical protein
VLLLQLLLLLQKGRGALVMGGGSPTLSYWCFIPGADGPAKLLASNNAS